MSSYHLLNGHNLFVPIENASYYNKKLIIFGCFLLIFVILICILFALLGTLNTHIRITDSYYITTNDGNIVERVERVERVKREKVVDVDKAQQKGHNITNPAKSVLIVNPAGYSKSIYSNVKARECVARICEAAKTAKTPRYKFDGAPNNVKFYGFKTQEDTVACASNGIYYKIDNWYDWENQNFGVQNADLFASSCKKWIYNACMPKLEIGLAKVVEYPAFIGDPIGYFINYETFIACVLPTNYLEWFRVGNAIKQDSCWPKKKYTQEICRAKTANNVTDGLWCKTIEISYIFDPKYSNIDLNKALLSS